MIQGCLPGLEFRCGPGLPCLSATLLCDGVVDCDDGSDESNETCRMFIFFSFHKFNSGALRSLWIVSVMLR